MSKTKHNPPKKPKLNFIKFSKVQRAYINEMIARQQKELSEALGTVYEDLGIAEKILQAPPGTYILRQDFSGLDVLPVEIKIEKKPESEKKSLLHVSKDKGGKDN